MHRRKDGTYTSVFRQFKDGKETIKQTEAGLWGYVNGIYFTLTREMLDHENFKAVDTTQGEYYDAYKVLKFDGKELTYKDLLYGNEYTVRKVPDNYIF